MAGIGEREDAGVEIEHAADDRDEQPGPALVHEDAVRPLERLDRVARVIEGRSDDRPEERHHQRRGDALARYVGNHDTELARSFREREDVEEVTTDGARRPVVARELPAVGLDAREEDERPLDPMRDLQLALEELCLRGRRSGSLESCYRVVARRVHGEEAGHPGSLENARDRILHAGKANVPALRLIGSHLAQRAPATLGIGRGLAAHDSHGRVECEQPRAGHERQARQVEHQPASAGRVGISHHVDDLLVVRRVELPVERDHRDGRAAVDALDIDRHRHGSVLLGWFIDRAHQGELVATIGSCCMMHRIRHRPHQPDPHAHAALASWPRDAAGRRDGRGRRVEGRRSVQDPDLYRPAQETRLDVDLARLAPVAVEHDVARRLVDRLDEIFGDRLRAAEVGDGVANERAHLGEAIWIRHDAQGARLVLRIRHDQACSSTRLPSGSAA